MMAFIFRFIVSLITFSIGVSFALIFTVDRASSTYCNLQSVDDVKSAAVAVPLYSQVPFIEPNITESTTELFLSYDSKKFNPRGDYYILGQKPKEFREVDVFELAVSERDGNPDGAASFGTYSNGTPNSSYTVSGTVTRKQLIFFAVPDSEEGFEYRFNGRFLKDGWVYTAKKNQAVVKGKLSKLKNGVKIAECEVAFRVEYLGC